MRLHIHGVARNLADGSVQVLARGAPLAVEELIRWLHRGPAQARVESVIEVTLADANSAVPRGFVTE